MSQPYTFSTMRRSSNDEQEVIIENMGQINENVRRMKVENLEFERFRNITLKQKYNFQADIDALKIMHDRLKCYLDHNQSQQIHQFNLYNPVSKPIDSPDPEPNKVDIKLVKIPWSVEGEMPFFNEHNIVMRYSLATDSVLCSIRYSPDGSMFAFANGRTVFFMNSEDGSLNGMCNIPMDDDTAAKCVHTRSICFSPDSKYLALSGPKNKVIVVDTTSKKVIDMLECHSNAVSTLTFSKDSQYLYSGGFDGKICMWDLKTMKLHKTIQPQVDPTKKKSEIVMAIAISADNSFIAVGYMSGSVAIIDLMLNGVIDSFDAHQSYLMDINSGPNDSFATASQDKTAKIWDSNKPSHCKNTLSGHGDFVLTVCFSPNDPLILTGSKDETIKGWNEQTGELLFTLQAQHNTVFQIDHHPLYKTFISCSGDGIICVWDYKMPEPYEMTQNT